MEAELQTYALIFQFLFVGITEVSLERLLSDNTVLDGFQQR